jgi:stromal membrane-associated protein
MANANKAALKEQLRRMEAMLNRPENRECFDCNCKGPRWASINLGVFICMRCAGIHRSLGTHITKVRSINMDVWEPQNIEFIERMGNANAKLVWEARLPATYRKPDLNADSKDVEKILREKYELKRYSATDADQRIKDILEGRLQAPSEDANAASPVTLASPQSGSPQTVASPTSLAPPSAPPLAAAPRPTFQAPAPQAPPPPKEIDLIDFGAMNSAPPQSGPNLGGDFFSGPATGFQDSSKNNIMAAFDAPRPGPPGKMMMAGGPGMMMGGPFAQQQQRPGPPQQQQWGAPPQQQQQWGAPPPQQQQWGAPPPQQQQWGSAPPPQQQWPPAPQYGKGPVAPPPQFNLPNAPPPISQGWR